MGIQKLAVYFMVKKKRNPSDEG